MFIASLFTVAKMWKQPKSPLIDEWIKKIWYIHTMNIIQPYKRKYFHIQLEKVKQISHRRANPACFHLYQVYKIVKETERRMVFASIWEKEEMGSCYSMGINFTCAR